VLPNAAARIRGDAAVVLLSFVALGVPIGMLGVAWPAMRADLAAPTAGLGLLLSALTLLEAGSSAVAGAVHQRIGARPMLVGSTLGAALSLTIVGAAGGWEIAVAGALLLGAALGFLDVAVNAYGTLTQGIRYLGALHGSWAVGATLGPPLVGLAIVAGGSWRVGFLILAGCFLLVGIGLARAGLPSTALHQAVAHTPAKIRTVVLGCVIFFLYVGIEVGAGSWSFVRLADGGIAAAAAGAAVTGYWAMLALSRIGLALWGDRAPAETLLDLALVGTGIAGLAVWLLPVGLGAFVALPLLGFALGAIIPLLVYLTPRRVGRGSASSVIGLQFASAMLGGATIPAAIGYAMELGGSATLGPAIAVLSVALIATYVAAREPALAAPKERPEVVDRR